MSVSSPMKRYEAVNWRWRYVKWHGCSQGFASPQTVWLWEVQSKCHQLSQWEWSECCAVSFILLRHQSKRQKSGLWDTMGSLQVSWKGKYVFQSDSQTVSQTAQPVPALGLSCLRNAPPAFDFSGFEAFIKVLGHIRGLPRSLISGRKQR